MVPEGTFSAIRMDDFYRQTVNNMTLARTLAAVSSIFNPRAGATPYPRRILSPAYGKLLYRRINCETSIVSYP
jgi:hypothetical protein